MISTQVFCVQGLLLLYCPGNRTKYMFIVSQGCAWSLGARSVRQAAPSFCDLLSGHGCAIRATDYGRPVASRSDRRGRGRSALNPISSLWGPERRRPSDLERLTWWQTPELAPSWLDPAVFGVIVAHARNSGSGSCSVARLRRHRTPIHNVQLLGG